MSSKKKTGEKKPAGEKKARKKPVDDGIPKADKAKVTRFCRDVLLDENYATMNLSVGKVRKAVWGDEKVRQAVLVKGGLVWKIDGFDKALEVLIKSIPSGTRRRRMTPEQKTQFAVDRRAAILETATGGIVNEHSLQALKSAYLQGLKEQDRANEKDFFEQSVA